jgi:hypothetical protein
MQAFILGPKTNPASPGTLSYTATASDPALRHFALQASNGRYIVMLWREQKLYDHATKTRLSVPWVPVRVNAPAGTWQVIYPASGNILGAYESSGSSDVFVGGELAMLVV